MEYKTLSDRMKGAYENKYRNYLPENIPVITRLDGAHFHNFCRGMKKPFDPIFVKTMQQTMLKLCEIIPNVKFGYVESDEISLVMIQSERNSQPWFDNNIQKIVSTSAALCTLWFNNYFAENTIIDTSLDIYNINQDSYDWKMARKVRKCLLLTAEYLLFLLLKYIIILFGDSRIVLEILFRQLHRLCLLKVKCMVLILPNCRIRCLLKRV